MTLEPGWIKRSIEETRRQTAWWPNWMRKAAGMEEKTEETPSFGKPLKINPQDPSTLPPEGTSVLLWVNLDGNWEWKEGWMCSLYNLYGEPIPGYAENPPFTLADYDLTSVDWRDEKSGLVNVTHYISFPPHPSQE